MNTPDSPALAVEDTTEATTFAAVFGTTGKWNRELGTLILTLQVDSHAGRQYPFKFVLKNPSSCDQDNQTIRVQAGCCPECMFHQDLAPDSSATTDVCSGEAGYGKPLQIIKPEFLTKSIWQVLPILCF